MAHLGLLTVGFGFHKKETIHADAELGFQNSISWFFICENA
jgi:hypothetical protein